MPLGVWRDIIGNSDVVRAPWFQIMQWVDINSEALREFTKALDCLKDASIVWVLLTKPIGALMAIHKCPNGLL